MWLKINTFTSVKFVDKKPTYVSWQLSDLSEWPEDEELIKEVKSKLRDGGWEVKIATQIFDSYEPYSDYGAKITVLN